MSTCCGKWNAPARFFPSSVLMPVLPPIAASTIPTSVVGTATHRTPRRCVAATKPATSVVEPPPKPTIQPSRPIPSSLHRRSTTASVFASSPLGTTWVVAGASSQCRAAARLVSSTISAASVGQPDRGADSKRRQEERRRDVFALALRRPVVESRTLVVEPPELLAVPSERTAGFTDARPGVSTSTGTQATNAVRARRSRVCSERTAPPPSAITDGRAGKRLRDDLLLDPAEFGLAALEELADRAEALFDLLVGVDERAVRAGARARGRASTSPRP